MPAGDEMLTMLLAVVDLSYDHEQWCVVSCELGYPLIIATPKIS